MFLINFLDFKNYCFSLDIGNSFYTMMISITQTNTGTMVKRVPQEQMFVIEATLYL